MNQRSETKVGNTTPNVINMVIAANNLQVGNNNIMMTANYSDGYESDESAEDFSQAQEEELNSSNVQLDEQLSQEIASQFQKNWFKLGKILQIPEEELTEVSKLNQGMKKMAYDVLQKWKSNYQNATVADLAHCLENDEDSDAENRILLHKIMDKRQKLIPIEQAEKRKALKWP